MFVAMFPKHLLKYQPFHDSKQPKKVSATILIPFKNTIVEIDLPFGKLTYPHFEREIHLESGSIFTLPKD